MCQFILHCRQQAHENLPLSEEEVLLPGGTLGGGVKKRENPTTKEWFDVNRTMRFAVLGTALIGGGLHYWYGALNKYISGNGYVPVLQRTILDQALMAPCFISTFMSLLLLLEQGRFTGIDPIRDKLNQDFWDIVKTNWCVWIPVQFVNFGVVPPQYQVLFSNVVGLGWNTYLSFKVTGNKKSDENS